MKRSATKQEGESASQLISRRIAELDDWRGETLGRIRELIKAADPGIVEEWKWWDPGLVARRDCLHRRDVQEGHVKMTFAKGAFVKDPSASLQLQPRRQLASSHRHQGGRED